MKQPKSANFIITALLNEADTPRTTNPTTRIPKQVSEPVAETEDKTAIDQNIQRHIGRKLKASYEELIKQPVPDKFKTLLEELQRKEKKQ